MLFKGGQGQLPYLIWAITNRYAADLRLYIFPAPALNAAHYFLYGLHFNQVATQLFLNLLQFEKVIVFHLCDLF